MKKEPMSKLLSLKGAVIAAFMVSAPLFVSSHGVAQDAAGPVLSLSAGVSQWDLSGTGTTSMLALRGTMPLSSIVLVEAGFLVMRPEQQFGERTTFVVPEAQLQLQWPLGRFAPYLGIGAGAALDFASEQAGGLDSDLTISGAGGLRLNLTDQWGAQTELRARGIGTGFEGATAEYTVGLMWRW